MCIAAGRLAELGLEIELEVDRDWVDVQPEIGWAMWRDSWDTGWMNGWTVRVDDFSGLGGVYYLIDKIYSGH